MRLDFRLPGVHNGREKMICGRALRTSDLLYANVSRDCRVQVRFDGAKLHEQHLTVSVTRQSSLKTALTLSTLLIVAQFKGVPKVCERKVDSPNLGFDAIALGAAEPVFHALRVKTLQAVLQLADVLS